MTTKQAKAINGVIDQGLSIYKAKLQAGYTETQARKTEKLTQSDAWKEVMNQYLPTSKLFKKHEEALEANKIHGTGDDFIEIPDHTTRLKAIELAYKLKGMSGESGGNTNTQINISYDGNGYIPPNNTLTLKPTLTNHKRKTLKAK